MKIGETYYYFDTNHRVYDGKGLSANLIYAEHWRPVKIISETEKEFVCDRGTINKRSKMLTLYNIKKLLFSKREVDDDIWLNNNRHRLSEAVRNCRDAKTLKQVATLVGYEEIR